MILGVTSDTDGTFTLPLQNATTTITVDWGDASSDVITTYNQAELTHTYASTSTNYDITISGQFGGIKTDNSGDKLLIKEIKNWGTTVLSSMYYAFAGATNLTITATDYPDVSAVASFQQAFISCSSITVIDMSNWDCTSATTFASCFQSCTSLTTFTKPTSTPLVNSFDSMFYVCTSLTAIDLSGLITANVTSMYLFARQCSSATSINLTGGVYTGITNWGESFFQCSSLVTLDMTNMVTSATTRLDYMFQNCTSLTTITSTGWVTTGVTNVINHMYNCPSLTSYGIDSWNIEAIANWTFFAGLCTLPTALYDATLIAWDAQNPIDSKSVTFGSSKYTGGGTAATARANLISTDLWSITDGGIA
jgi:surface protein